MAIRKRVRLHFEPKTRENNKIATPNEAFIRRETANQTPQTLSPCLPSTKNVLAPHGLPYPAVPDDAEIQVEGWGGEGELYSVDTLVTVVDATTFLDEVRVADYLEDRGMEAQEGDTRTIADLLVTQARKRRESTRQRWTA